MYAIMMEKIDLYLRHKIQSKVKEIINKRKKKNTQNVLVSNCPINPISIYMKKKSCKEGD